MLVSGENEHTSTVSADLNDKVTQVEARFLQHAEEPLLLT